MTTSNSSDNPERDPAMPEPPYRHLKPLEWRGCLLTWRGNYLAWCGTGKASPDESVTLTPPQERGPPSP